MRRMKRVVVVADLHSGARTGLTPPHWQQTMTNSGTSWMDKIAALEREAWSWYAQTIESLQPIDIAIVNADCIDGRGEKSGSTELLTSDRHQQCLMALEALKLLRAKHYVMTYGTPYHVSGDGEDFEDMIARDLSKTRGIKSVKIGAHEWPEVNGLVFDVKHKIGGSQVPYGRYTPLAKDQIWNLLWHERDEQPRGQVFIRSHVHVYVHCGEEDWMAVTTPALQTMGTKFGSRQCSGRVNFGLLHFDVEKGGDYTWQAHIAKLELQKARTLVL